MPAGERGAEMDPRIFPPVNLMVDDFRYKERELGSVNLQASKVANGLRFDQLILKPEATTINLRGSWTVVSGGQRSRMNMNLESDDLESTLKSLGYVGTLSRGKGTVAADLAWQAGMLDVSPANIQGEVRMDLKDGFLLDINPGAGRLCSGVWRPAVRG